MNCFAGFVGHVYEKNVGEESGNDSNEPNPLHSKRFWRRSIKHTVRAIQIIFEVIRIVKRFQVIINFSFIFPPIISRCQAMENTGRSV